MDAGVSKWSVVEIAAAHRLVLCSSAVDARITPEFDVEVETI
jgi:hypothetical protein